MYRRSQIAALLAVSCAAAAPAPANRILGVAEAGKPFLVGSVQTKPEAGPVPVVDGDRVQSLGEAVSFRLEGENRAVLPENSTVGVRRYGVDGVYLYLTKGSVRFDARKQPLAICVRDRLYVPSIPASGEVSMEDGSAQVRMTAGTMILSGKDACSEKAAPAAVLSGASGAAGGAGSAAGTATATATAAGAGVATSSATVGAIAIAAGAATGAASTIAVVSSTPPAESPITPAQ